MIALARPPNNTSVSVILERFHFTISAHFINVSNLAPVHCYPEHPRSLDFFRLHSCVLEAVFDLVIGS